jgi:hypothetical protein
VALALLNVLAVLAVELSSTLTSIGVEAEAPATAAGSGSGPVAAPPRSSPTVTLVGVNIELTAISSRRDRGVGRVVNQRRRYSGVVEEALPTSDHSMAGL